MAHQYGTYNVTNSINYFINNNLGTFVPSWFPWMNGVSPPRSLNFNYPDVPLNFPSFSVTHTASDPVINSQGDRAGGFTDRAIMRQGSMSISCWVLEIVTDANGKPTGEKNNQWWQQLQQMRDAIMLLLEQNRLMLIYDFTNPNSPTQLTARLWIKDIRERSFTPDPNPAVKRWIITATYRWAERWTQA